jgi:hypothetical protein
MQRPSLRNAGLLLAAGLTLALGGAPLLATGADHLDAPALGGLTNMAGEFSPHSEHGDRDINDVYVFQGANASRTVLAMTTNPAANFFGAEFGTNVRYIINVDRDGDARQDLAYVWRFYEPNGSGAQEYAVVRYTGANNARRLVNGLVIGSGWTSGSGVGTAKGNAKVFAGLRSDPFFFDLTGFVGTVFNVGDDNLDVLDGDHNDFFAGLNTNAVVIEVSDDSLGGDIGVWGATSYFADGTWKRGDQMGRPAINTVFNNGLVDPSSGQTKNRFNRTAPADQRTAYDGLFRNNIVATLTNINAVLGTTGAPFNCSDYAAGPAGDIADLLLPDVLTYDTSTVAAGPLNGRALADDVIDIELGLTTNGCVGTDAVDAHTDYLSSFPYLGVPH